MKPMVVLLLMLSATAAFGGVDAVLSVPQSPIRAASTVLVTVYLHNGGAGSVPVTAAERVDCRISSDGHTVTVAAARQTVDERPPPFLEPGHFLKLTYALVFPINTGETAHIALTDFQGAAATVMVEPPSADSFSAEKPPAGGIEPKGAPSIAELEALYQPYLSNLSAHEPMYFLVGTDTAESKFQISFKYRFFDPDKHLARQMPWISGFHFGYTQTSFWDLSSASLPFEDTSYKPELLFISPNMAFEFPRLRGLFLQTGVMHESNGRGGDVSRSTNTAYIAPMAVFYDSSTGYGLLAAPKIWTYFLNDNATNADLSDYRGYMGLDIKFGRADAFVLGANVRWAEEGASLQVDFTYPLHRFFGDNLNFYFHTQYVNALAESLIDYRQRTQALRFGFSIVR